MDARPNSFPFESAACVNQNEALKKTDRGEGTTMRRRLLTAATSLTLVFLVALGARLGFAWDQTRKIPREVIGLASFAQETGSIASALVRGKGFSSPFGRETGPTA